MDRTENTDGYKKVQGQDIRTCWEARRASSCWRSCSLRSSLGEPRLRTVLQPPHLMTVLTMQWRRPRLLRVYSFRPHSRSHLEILLHLHRYPPTRLPAPLAHPATPSRRAILSRSNPRRPPVFLTRPSGRLHACLPALVHPHCYLPIWNQHPGGLSPVGWIRIRPGGQVPPFPESGVFRNIGPQAGIR